MDLQLLLRPGHDLRQAFVGQEVETGSTKLVIRPCLHISLVVEPLHN